MENLRFMHLSWDDIQRITEALAEKIKASGFKPDVVVAVSRGGFDPARILCDQLGIRRLASVQVEAYDGMVKRPEPEVILPVNDKLDGKNVLVVDDVSDSGASLLKVKEYIEGKAAREVRIATLHIKPWSKYLPYYYVASVEAWVVYPWELRECLLEVAEKIRASGEKEDTVSKKLIEVGFKKSDVEHYIPHQ